MSYQPKRNQSGKHELTADDCEQTTDTLMEYRRKGIPLMPHQIAYLQKNGFRGNLNQREE